MTSSDVNQDLLRGFIDESSDGLTSVDGLLVKLENNPQDLNLVNSVFRPIHSLKGNAAYFGMMKIKTMAHTLENLLDMVRKGQRTVNRHLIDTLLPGIDSLRSMLAHVRNGEPEVSDPEAYQAIISNVESLLQNAPTEDIAVSQAIMEDQPKGTPETNVHHDKTMRIPEQSLDDFLRCVGELLGVEEMLRHLTRQLNSGIDLSIISANFRDAVTQFEGISKELRTKIMEVRKVEAKVLLQKAPRLVRDVATQAGKKIQVTCHGEEVHIDKSYIDLLDAPLTHMVRNAADHGIESPAQRINNGKAEVGQILVAMSENSDNLQLIVQDDGAGLNYEGLQKKAVTLGIISPNTQLSKKDVVDLLFMSGVSTASQVTDVSGRGVGMDVVKRAIIDAGGQIDVESSPNAGTKFTVTLPRNASTQIFDGYIVRSFANDLFVLPISFVVEAFRMTSETISQVPGKGSMISRRDRVFPMYLLDKILGSSDVLTHIDMAESMGILLNIKGHDVVLAVQDIVGIQKVVNKQVEGHAFNHELFEGAAISGTGQVMMIVNMENLLRQV